MPSSITSGSNLCFICNEETDVDHLEYASGGLGRCALDTAGKHLKRCMNKYILDKTHPWYKSARRLDLLLKGSASDIWASDVYTLKICYINFAFCYERTEKVNEEAEILALDTFFFKIRQKILREKCAFVLTDLYDDLVSICEELKLKEPVITNN